MLKYGTECLFCAKKLVTLHGKFTVMAKKKILFINQEISPYVPDNNLSLMGKDLPQAMQERNHEIRTFMPNGVTSMNVVDNFMR